MSRTSGYTLIELLVTLFIMLFIIIAFFKGIWDLFKYNKRTQIYNVARELGEKIRSEIYVNNYTDLINCSSLNPLPEAKLIFNETSNNVYIDKENDPTFYTMQCQIKPDCTILNCRYCYKVDQVKPLAQNEPCVGGYLINVGYNLAQVKNEPFNEEVGLAMGMKIFFNDTITSQVKEINYFVFKEK